MFCGVLAKDPCKVLGLLGPSWNLLAKFLVMTVFFEEAREEGLRFCVISGLEAEGPSLASSHSSWLIALDPGSTVVFKRGHLDFTT